MTNKKQCLNFYLPLFLIFISLASPKAIGFGKLSGALVFVWICCTLYLTQTLQSKKNLWLTYFAFVLGYSVKFYGLTGSFFIDMTVLIFLGSVIFSLFIINRKLVKKRYTLASTLVFPMLWLLGYLFITLVKVPISMRLDVLFFDYQTLMQAGSVVRAYGLSITILWISTLIVYTILTKRKIGIVISLLSVVFLYSVGTYRLSNAKEPVSFVKVAYSTGPYVGTFIDYDILEYDSVIDHLDSTVNSAAKTGAKILAFNEVTYEIADTNEQDFISTASRLAKENNIHILVGLDIYDTDNSENGKSINKIVWVDNNGNVLDKYSKYNVLPIIEAGYVAGNGKIPSHEIDIDGEKITVSFAICYDSNFPDFIDKMDKNTDILFLPSWDWKSVDEIHYKICGAISIYNGVTLLKPTYDGYTVATNPYGQIIKLTHTNDTGYSTIQTVDLPIYRGHKL